MYGLAHADVVAKTRHKKWHKEAFGNMTVPVADPPCYEFKKAQEATVSLPDASDASLPESIHGIRETVHGKHTWQWYLDSEQQIGKHKHPLPSPWIQVRLMCFRRSISDVAQRSEILQQNDCTVTSSSSSGVCMLVLHPLPTVVRRARNAIMTSNAHARRRKSWRGRGLRSCVFALAAIRVWPSPWAKAR